MAGTGASRKRDNVSVASLDSPARPQSKGDGAGRANFNRCFNMRKVEGQGTGLRRDALLTSVDKNEETPTAMLERSPTHTIHGEPGEYCWALRALYHSPLRKGKKTGERAGELRVHDCLEEHPP